MLQPTPDTRLGDLVTAFPSATRVLLRHDLDFCCGGKQTLKRACEKRGLGVDALVQELTLVVSKDAEHRPWDQAPLGELIDHILERYHAPLPEDLSQLQAMADKVLRVHGDKDPERLAALSKALQEITADVLPHMAKEERILFPWIRERAVSGDVKGGRPAPVAPIAVMESDHGALGELLATVKALTNDFTPPPEACATWTNLYARLKTVDRELREHIHLENNVLHPRAIALWATPS